MNLARCLKAAFTFGLVATWMATPVHAELPTVVLSLRSIDEILDDADFIGDALGQPGLKMIAEGTIDALTGGAGLAGVDREQPLGLYWSMTESDPNMLGTLVVFVPISNEDDFEELVKKFVPDLKSEDDQWSMTVQGLPLFATISNGYCFISNSKEGLTDLVDPAEIVNDEYDIAIEVYLGSIPQQAKETFLSITEQGARNGAQEQPEPKNEAEASGRELGMAWTLAAIKAVTNDGDRVTFGLDVDRETQIVALDLGLSGKPNTTLAHAMAIYGQTTPTFAAVASDSAPFRLVMSLPTTGMIEQINGLIDAMRKTSNAEIEKDPKLQDDADRKAAKDVVNRLFNIAQATVKSGSLHSVIVLEEGDEETVRVIGGIKVAQGDDAGQLLDDILKLSKESPDLAKIKPDVAKHAGARIHAIIPDLTDKQTAMFGRDPTHLAIRADSLWLSLGGGNLKALKNAIGLSGKKASRSEPPISLRLKPATLITLVEMDNPGLVQRAEALAGEPGDLLNIEVVPDESAGIKIHIEFGIELFGLADFQLSPVAK